MTPGSTKLQGGPEQGAAALSLPEQLAAVSMMIIFTVALVPVTTCSGLWLGRRRVSLWSGLFCVMHSISFWLPF